MARWTASGWQVFWRAAALYSLAAAFLLYIVATGTAGFSYALDLPYVQLALAQHIAHGTYGINAGETTSPVASIAWPLLLAAFAHCSFLQWVPLLFNVLSGLGVCALAAFWVDWYWQRGWQRLSGSARWLLAFLFVLAANLPALALVGMEHTLQVLIAGGCAAAIMEAYFGRKMPAVCLVCAVLAPAIRYEDLAFTLAVCVACWSTGRRRSAAAVAGSSMLPLLIFGAFLHRHGLRVIPPSVFTEGRIFPDSLLREHAPGAGLLPGIASVNIQAYVSDPQRWPVALFLLALCVQVGRVRNVQVRRNILIGATLCLALLMVLGPYGYFYRLDVAYRFFAFLLVFATVAEYEWFGCWPTLGTGALAAAVYVLATLQVCGAAWATAHEQKQLQRFVQAFYKGDVLMTDPGWAAFDSRDRLFVLAAESSGRNPLQSELAAHRVQLAMLSSRLPVDLPPEWKRVAVLCRYGDGFNCTTVFHSPSLREDVISNELRAFAATLPTGTWISYEDGSRSDVP